MVIGLEYFKEYFKEYKDCYLIIGGTACDIILENEGFTPRATNDIDIILIVEAFTPAFVKKFWDFVREGQYKTQQKETQKRSCYRFAKPLNPGFPKQLELFCRVPDAIELDDTAHLTPIPTEEGLSNLSAILLNEDYYQFTRANSKQINDAHLALPHTLICLKAFAYISNKNRKAAGEPVQSGDISKHKNDVFRLVLLLKPEEQFSLPQTIKKDMQQFADDIRNDLPNASILRENGFGTQNMGSIFNQLLKSFLLA